MTWETGSLIALALIAFWMGYRTLQENRTEWPEDDENDPPGDASLLSRDGRQ